MPESPFEFRHSGTGRQGADLRQPRHRRPVEGRLRADAARRPPERRVHPGLRHPPRRAPGDRPGRQLLRCRSPTRATVLPGASPTCTTTVTGAQTNVNVDHRRDVPQRRDGQRQRDGRRRAPRSCVKNSTVGGTLTATGAEAVQLFGSTVNGAARIANTTQVTSRSRAARSTAASTLTGNTQVTANDRYSRLAGAYGPILAGSTVNGALDLRRQQRRREGLRRRRTRSAAATAAARCAARSRTDSAPSAAPCRRRCR